MRLIAAALAVAGALLLAPARAEWQAQYAEQPLEVQQWYRNAELTAAAKRRFPFNKCCDHSDVVRSKFKVDRLSGGDEWYWLDGERWRRVPPDVIHWGETAPSKQPTLFVYHGQETCFFPGDGGI